jgi:hypothetical protein
MIAATLSSLIGTVFAGFISQYIGRMTTLTLFALAAIMSMSMDNIINCATKQ